MIRSLYIDNFKSLVDFRLPPAPHVLGDFTCLVGLNGAGKSTVLQAFDLLGHLVSGDVEAWLEHREWEKSDLTSRFLKKQLISFKLVVELEGGKQLEWSGSFNTVLLRCTAELVTLDGVDLLRCSDQHLFALQGGEAAPLRFPVQAFEYSGSILSALRPGRLHPALQALKEAAETLRSFDMLSPQSMRKRAKDGTTIGHGGERLSAYLHQLHPDAKAALLASLQRFYPQLQGWTTTALRAGWKDLKVVETYSDVFDKPLETGIRQLNDGLLRVLAILSQAHVATGPLAGPSPGCVLFDEIENGINPELIKRLVACLLDARQQVIVTTHSPLVLNYLPDDVAQAAVILMFRDRLGHTRAVRFFDLPSAQDRLGLLGPGEAFVDIPAETLLAEAGQATVTSP